MPTQISSKISLISIINTVDITDFPSFFKVFFIDELLNRK